MKGVTPESAAARRRLAPGDPAGLLLLLCAACVSLWGGSLRAQVQQPVQKGPMGAPPILRDVGIDHHEGAAIPFDLPFVDEAGQPVRLAQYFGKRPIILALVYYRCPMLCTMVLNDVTRTMNSLSESAGKDFDVLTISFDPKETPELAAAKRTQYLRAYRRAGSEQGWHFLTGDGPAIARLTTAVGFRYAWDPKFQQWAHASGIVILTPDGRISRYFYGIDYAPSDVRIALAEAGASKISPSAPAQALLYCFHYDPATGRYSLAILKLLQVLGVVTLLLIGASVFLAVRRDRRRVSP